MDDKKFMTITELISITDLCTTLARKLANIDASSLTPEMKHGSPDFEMKIVNGQFQADQLKKAVREIIKLFTFTGGDFRKLCLPMIKALGEDDGGAGGDGTSQSLPLNDQVMRETLPLQSQVLTRRSEPNLNKRPSNDMNQEQDSDDDHIERTKKMKTDEQSQGKDSDDYVTELSKKLETRKQSQGKDSNNVTEGTTKLQTNKKFQGKDSNNVTEGTTKLQTNKKFEGKKFRANIITPSEIDVSLDDMCALEETKSMIRCLVISPIKMPDLFKSGLLQPCKDILLFGPSGTEKTMLAKAIARDCGANLINLSCYSFGRLSRREIELQTKALFSLTVGPTVIFIKMHKFRRLKSFLAFWDCVSAKAQESKGQIIVLGATNRPFDLDEAIIKRFKLRIFVNFPCEKRRESILRAILAKENVEDIDLKELAAITDGYGVNDLKKLCAAAAYKPLAELVKQESSAIPVVESEIRRENPTLRPININDLKQARNDVQPRSANETSDLFKKWNNSYGGGGCKMK